MNSLLEFFKDSFMLKLLTAIMALLFSMDIEAQVNKNSELFKTLNIDNNILLEEIFDQCKIEKILPYIHKKLSY